MQKYCPLNIILHIDLNTIPHIYLLYRPRRPPNEKIDLDVSLEDDREGEVAHIKAPVAHFGRARFLYEQYTLMSNIIEGKPR